MNKEIVEKLENNDVVGITAKAASSFMSVLSRDEIKTCILNAVWKALKKYNSEAGCKFTTYLYRGVVMACLTQQKFNSSQRCQSLKLDYPDPTDYEFKAEMLDMVENCDDPDLMYYRYYKNMTIKEMAQQRGVCGETIRIKIKKNLKKLKEHLL